MLGQSSRAYAIDLLGYGYSDKPDPRSEAPCPQVHLDGAESSWSDHMHVVFPQDITCTACMNLSRYE